MTGTTAYTLTGSHARELWADLIEARLVDSTDDFLGLVIGRIADRVLDAESARQIAAGLNEIIPNPQLRHLGESDHFAETARRLEGSEADQQIYDLMLQLDQYADRCRRGLAAIFTQSFVDPLASAIRVRLEAQRAFTRDRVGAVIDELREARR